MAILEIQAGAQLTQIRKVTALNFLDVGLTDAQVLPLHTSGLPEFRDAVRAMMDLASGTFAVAGPDDGDTVWVTRDKCNAIWQNYTP